MEISDYNPEKHGRAVIGYRWSGEYHIWNIYKWDTIYNKFINQGFIGGESQPTHVFALPTPPNDFQETDFCAIIAPITGAKKHGK